MDWMLGYIIALGTGLFIGHHIGVQDAKRWLKELIEEKEEANIE